MLEESPYKPPHDAAGCMPCEGCVGFRLPNKKCNCCGYEPWPEGMPSMTKEEIEQASIDSGLTIDEVFNK